MGYYSHHPLYNTWRGMMDRCYRQSVRYYRNYGGRGILVCAEWHDAKTFIEWGKQNGWEEGLQIDRIDNDGSYEPENCRFVTRKDNCRNARHNRLIAHNGVTATLAEWCEITGLNKATIRGRLRRGWTTPQALTLSPQRGRKP